MEINHLPRRIRLIFVIKSDRAGSSVKRSPPLANIHAIKNCHIYEFDESSSWLYSGAIANHKIVQYVVDSIL